MRAHQINLLNGMLQIHLPNLKCPETTKMQPKHNPVRHVFRWVTFVAHHSLVVFLCFFGFFFMEEENALLSQIFDHLLLNNMHYYLY